MVESFSFPFFMAQVQRAKKRDTGRERNDWKGKEGGGEWADELA